MIKVGNRRGFSRRLEESASARLNPAEPVVRFFIGGRENHHRFAPCALTRHWRR
jgi:hypothetical protein